MTCEHARVAPEVCDQTLGVKCLVCNALLAWCWQDDHVPESLWNRACENEPGEAIPCPDNRDNVCALCSELVTTHATPKDGGESL